jgi:hypothetical protein
MERLLLISLLGLISPAMAADYTLSWTVSSPTGITEYAIGSKVNGVAQPVEYTGAPILVDTVSRTAATGQTVAFNVAACNATACGAWGPTASLVAGPGTAPAGTVSTTTATSVRVGPPALP